MEGKELTKHLDAFLKTRGFKKKGKHWYFNSIDLIKVINLQKSSFGDVYYLNYGYIIPELSSEYPDPHVFHQLSSINEQENMKIKSLLNLENKMDDTDRILEIVNLIESIILVEFSKINSEEDLANHLHNREYLNDILLVIKRRYNLV